MNEARLQVVKQAYEKLDKNHDGHVTLEDIAGLYDATQNSDVRAGRASPEEIFNTFMSSWDRSKDGIVTFDEFADYYGVIFV